INIIFLFILLSFLKRQPKENVNSVNYYMIGTCFNVLSLSSFMFDRIGIYFFVFQILVIPKLIEKIENRNLRLLLFIIAIIIATIFYVQSVIINSESLNLEYNSIFS